MEPILVSACLVGQAVRYDARARQSPDAILRQWRDEGRLVPVCPEVTGGLPVPRPPAEIVPVGPPGGEGQDGAAVLDGTARVLTVHHEDVTRSFLLGASQALAAARRCGARMAILKENSPSCGLHTVHDGSFSGRLSAGPGVTTALLERNGIRVFSEHECEAAAAYLAALERLGQADERSTEGRAFRNRNPGE